MALLGKAAVAMWWTIAPEHRAEFHDWHSREHLPERLSIPGFLRGSRWQAVADPGAFFVIYELDRYQTLVSPGYLDRLNAPTPWSTRMMPLHQGMTRSQCHIVTGQGAGVATYMAPLRLSPAPGSGAALEQALTATFATLAGRRGITGAHLLRTDTPQAAPTTEQLIRGGDAVADWIVLLTGHDAAALHAALAEHLSANRLQSAGAASVIPAALHHLVHCVTPQDVMQG